MYVLTTDALRVFVGTEACDFDPLREYRTKHPRVDVVSAPIDGSAFMGRKLVMTPKDSIAVDDLLRTRHQRSRQGPRASHEVRGAPSSSTPC